MNAIVDKNKLHNDAQSLERGMLRFITAGSVDDGKSTLIGRLLFDSKGIFADQLDAISRARHKRTVGDMVDLSLLTDGLEAEREQGITIDVSKVTISADGQAELLIQTKRHSTIAKLLQIQHVIVAVNKMDLINYDQTIYNQIVASYQKFAEQLGLKGIHPIPLSALAGDNVVTRGEKLSWYQGPTLIELLESLSVYDDEHKAAFRFPVQLVARHNGHEANDFRGYMGRVEAGTVHKGDVLTVQPSGQRATVKDILTLDGSLDSASAGKSITLLLEEYLDISRGDMLASAEAPANLLKNFSADVCWLSEEPLDLGRKYWLKHTTRQVAAKVTGIDSLLNINTQQAEAGSELKLNGIARIQLTVQQPLAADSYDAMRSTGSFILIDEISHQTVAAGMIRLA